MIICLCGKSGSGKSTIAKLLIENIPNSIHIDIDKIGHQSHNDEKVKEQLITTFGKIILTNENIDRKKLGKIVFSSKEDMKKLEDITWNYMKQEIDNVINNNKDKIIILDWLLLPKTKYFDNCELRVLIDVPYEIRKQRAIERDNITSEQFDLRENSSIQYDITKFNYIIKNNDIEKVKRMVLNNDKSIISRKF